MYAWIIIGVFAAGTLYVVVADDPGSARETAVHRVGRLLWGSTVASLVGGLAGLVAVLWFLVGAVWMLVFNSERFAPSPGTRDALAALYLWPYRLGAYGVTGAGSDPGLRPPTSG